MTSDQAVEPLRRKIEEAIYNVSPEFDDDDNKITYQQSLDNYSDWLRSVGKDPSARHSWERVFQKEADAALTAIREAGYCLVRRDDMETVIAVAEQSDFYESEHDEPMGRLRAAVKGEQE